MKATRIFIGILSFAVLAMAAEAIATDFWTWHEYRSQIKAQKAEIERLEANLLEYQRTVTNLKHEALAAK